jgi:hypothetical protein
MSKERHDPKDTQRHRVLAYVKALQERGETYRGRTAAEHFDAEGDFWTQDQIERFVLEGKINYLREIVNSIPTAGGKEEARADPEPVYSVVRQTTEGADHVYVPPKKLDRQDWYDKIAEALNLGITFQSKAKGLLEKAKTELPKKDFGWLTEQLCAKPEFQLLLNIDQSERSSVHTSRKKRMEG